jgi:hypothetical protein
MAGAFEGFNAYCNLACAGCPVAVSAKRNQVFAGANGLEFGHLAAAVPRAATAAGQIYN